MVAVPVSTSTTPIQPTCATMFAPAADEHVDVGAQLNGFDVAGGWRLRPRLRAGLSGEDADAEHEHAHPASARHRGVRNT